MIVICPKCKGENGNHIGDCQKMHPRRFRVATNGDHPTGRKVEYRYGCYFPFTDLCVGDMGGRGTGAPEDVEWIDEKPEWIK